MVRGQPSWTRSRLAITWQQSTEKSEFQSFSVISLTLALHLPQSSFSLLLIKVIINSLNIKKENLTMGSASAIILFLATTLQRQRFSFSFLWRQKWSQNCVYFEIFRSNSISRRLCSLTFLVVLTTIVWFLNSFPPFTNTSIWKFRFDQDTETLHENHQRLMSLPLNIVIYFLNYIHSIKKTKKAEIYN